MDYKKRLLETKLRQLGDYFPAVVLTGARQVGKTTLLKHLQPGARHITFDAVVDVGNARQDPELFLDQLQLPIILDEIQYSPELLAVIKRRIDEKKVPGQYWLTGSQNLSVMQNVSESLAGRAAISSLYPLTLSERYSNATSWFSRFIANPQKFLSEPLSRILQNSSETLSTVLWKGGYPGLLELEKTNLQQDALASYFHTYIERDVRLLSEVSNLQEFSRFVQLVANLTAQEVHFTQLGREIGISPQTAQRWLSLLVSTNQWIELPAYSGNTLKRVSGKNKGYFIDTGMVCHLMHISTANALLGHPKLGALFETYVVNDILRQLPLLPGKPAIYHWRSHAGAEVDLLLEMDNIYYPIEIKCKSRPTKADIRGIQALRQTYPDLKFAPALLICPINDILALGNDCYAVPYDVGCSRI